MAQSPEIRVLTEGNAGVQAKNPATPLGSEMFRARRRNAATSMPPVAKALPPVKTVDVPTLAWSYADGGAATPLTGTVATLAHNTGRVLFYGMTPKDTNFGGTTPKWDRSNVVNAGKSSMYGVHFDTDDTDVCPAFRTNLTDFPVWIWVDDEPLTADPVLFSSMFGGPATAGATYRLRITFTSSKQRRIKIFVSSVSFRFLEHHVTTQVSPAPRPALSMCGGFDSLTNGALGLSDMETWGFRTALMLGMEYYSIGAGGRGYVTVDGGGYAKHSDDIVINAIAAVKPDYCVWVGSVNDPGAGVDVAATSMFSKMATLSPETQIIVAGPQQTNVPGLTAAARIAARDQVRAAAIAAPNVIGFLDILGTDANTVPWVAGYAWAVGNTTVYKGGVYRCTVAHNDGTTLDPTGWTLLGFLTGTGYSAGVTGDGNRDLYLGLDNVHWQGIGHKAFARYLLEQIVRVLSSPTFVDTYQLSTVRPTGQDSTVPPAVVLTKGATTATTMDLSWTAGPTATLYKIQRRDNSGTGFGNWYQVTTRTPPTVSIQFTALAAGWTYETRIVAANALGDGAPSNVVSHTAG
jgi:hypothetical protein